MFVWQLPVHHGRFCGDRLLAADVHLDKVRVYLRLAQDWRWLNMAQYEHASRMVAEMGRLLGGWQQATREGAMNK